MYDVEKNAKNKYIFLLSLTLSSWITLPIFFIFNSFYPNPYRYLISLILPYVFYIFLYKNIKLQLKLLIFFKSQLCLIVYKFFKKYCVVDLSYKCFPKNKFFGHFNLKNTSFTFSINFLVFLYLMVYSFFAPGLESYLFFSFLYHYCRFLLHFIIIPTNLKLI